MKWTEHVACMGETKNAFKFLSQSLAGGDLVGDLGINRAWGCGSCRDERWAL